MSSNCVTSPPQLVDALSDTLNRVELLRSPFSIPCREIVQVLTEIPTGTELGCHIHPGEEAGYIVTGTVEITIEGQPTHTLSAGDSFLVPPRTSHNARTIGPANDASNRHLCCRPWEPLTWFTRLTMTPRVSPLHGLGVQAGRGTARGVASRILAAWSPAG